MGIVVFRGGLGMVSPWMEHGNLQRYIAQHSKVPRYPLVNSKFSVYIYLLLTHCLECSVPSYLQAFHTFTVLMWLV